MLCRFSNMAIRSLSILILVLVGTNGRTAAFGMQEGISQPTSAVLPVAPTDGSSPRSSDDDDLAPRPTPVTRVEMKNLLENMKYRKERVSLPPISEEERNQSDGRAGSYESRLSSLYLPGGSGARGYMNFGGSSNRSPRPNNNRPNDGRPAQEQDPALTLDYGFKTRLFWLASRVNNCQYCLGHQESKLLAVGMSDDEIGALDLDWSSFPPGEQAAFALARRLSLEPQRLSDKDLDACREYFSELQILEMILSVSGNNAINRWKEGVGVPQSRTGGSFGAGNTDGHSYLTATNPELATKASAIVEGIPSAVTSPRIMTQRDLKKTSSSISVAEGLLQARNRQARLPVKSNEETHALFDGLELPEVAPQWMRVLANFPIAGKRQVTALLAAEKNLDLNDLTRARLAWVIARQNGAWYSLAQADATLTSLGQTRAQILELDTFETSDSVETLTPRDKALLTVARNLGASPVVLTDAEAARAIELAGPRDFVQTVHYTAMRSLFDRFTEACFLPTE